MWNLVVVLLSSDAELLQLFVASWQTERPRDDDNVLSAAVLIATVCIVAG